MSGTSIIFKKELKRVFGDKKLIFSLFIFPAIIMIAVYGLMGTMISSMVEDVEAHESIVTVVDAPSGLKELMQQTGYLDFAKVEFVDDAAFAAKEDAIRDEVLQGDTDLVVKFDSDFDDKVANFEKAGDAVPNMVIMYNDAENYSSQAYSVYGQMIAEPYQQILLSERLGDLSVLNVCNVSEEHIVKPEKANTEFISMMLPYMIMMLLFAGAMSVGVDAIAGEKERGTMSSMLLSPVKRVEIVMGKLLSLCVLAGISAIISGISMIVAMKFMGNAMSGTGEAGFGGLVLGPVQGIELLVIMLTCVFLFVALIGTLSIFAKDTKSASSLVSPFYIVVIVLGMMTMFASGKNVSTLKYGIPVYGSAMAIKDLCGNELLLQNFFATVGGTVIVAVILVVLMAKAFNSEKIMFNA